MNNLPSIIGCLLLIGVMYYIFSPRLPKRANRVENGDATADITQQLNAHRTMSEDELKVLPTTEDSPFYERASVYRLVGDATIDSRGDEHTLIVNGFDVFISTAELARALRPNNNELEVVKITRNSLLALSVNGKASVVDILPHLHRLQDNEQLEIIHKEIQEKLASLTRELPKERVIKS